MNRHPELFHSVLFAAPPFKPNINGYLRLHYGDVLGRNTKILHPEVAFTFPSALVLLPTTEEYNDPDVGFIVNSRGERVIIDFFNPTEWNNHGLGFASGQHLDKAELQHLANSLKDALMVKKITKLDPKINYPPIAILASRNYPTTHYAIKDGPKSIYGLDIDTPKKVDGDGSVPWNASVNVPKGVIVTIWESQLEHHRMLNSPHILEIIDDLHAQARNDNSEIIKFPASKL